MIHWDPGWLDSRLKIIVINIFVEVYGENELEVFFVAPVNHAHCDAL